MMIVWCMGGKIIRTVLCCIVYHFLLSVLLCYYCIRLAAFFQDNLVSQQQKGKPFWILLEQEMMGWHWHQPDHMQIVCTSSQMDNNASTSPLSFYGPDGLPAAQPTASMHWRPVYMCCIYSWLLVFFVAGVVVSLLCSLCVQSCD